VHAARQFTLFRPT